MKLILHSVVFGSSAVIPGTESFTSADVPAVPLVGDNLVLPGHLLIVQHRNFSYNPGYMMIELICAPTK